MNLFPEREDPMEFEKDELWVGASPQPIPFSRLGEGKYRFFVTKPDGTDYPIEFESTEDLLRETIRSKYIQFVRDYRPSLLQNSN